MRLPTAALCLLAGLTAFGAEPPKNVLLLVADDCRAAMGWPMIVARRWERMAARR